MPQQSPHRLHLLRACGLLLGIPVWLGACAETMAERTAWIQVGKTTKAEVIAYYGEPDLVFTEQEGETVTYRPATAHRIPPPVQIPTAQAGPAGFNTTQVQTIEPGLGKGDKVYRRPQKEIRIRYDAQGIVQEMLQ
jgi:hypothetical protein